MTQTQEKTVLNQQDFFKISSGRNRTTFKIIKFDKLKLASIKPEGVGL